MACLATLRRAAAALVLAMPAAAALAQSTPAACPPPLAPLSSEQMDSGMREARDRGFLWRVSKGGVTSWLYGTVHASRLEWVFPGTQVRDAMAAAETFALEMDPLDPTLQQRLTAALAARPGQELPAPLRARLARHLRGECLPEAALARFAPEMQIASLTITAARRDGLEAAYGTDVFLAGVAHGGGKPVVSLETPEEQARALLMPDPRETVAMVQSTLDEMDSGRARALMARVVKVWADADHDALARYDQWCGCRTTPADAATMKRLLDDRNPTLAERIAALHDKGKPVFAAVGSLHMIGPLGLPALMAQRGFVVEKVAFER
jgi:uncharacterized protein YbaP (TraB family)